jgi:hypothetical protein
MLNILIPLVVAINPIVPDCVNNFTTFYNNYANNSHVDVYRNYSDISAYDCGGICSDDTNCSSFNFFPENIFSSSSHSLCQLISSPFNRSTLVDGTYLAFYLRSENSCNLSNIKDIIIITSLSVISLIALLACCRCCRKRRSSYQELR